MLRGFLFVFLVAVLAPSGALHAAECGEGCGVPQDCTNPLCGVCDENTGNCSGCTDLTNSFDCTNSLTGASDQCFWTGSSCESVGAVPEVPGGWKWLLLSCGALLAVYFARRSKPSAG